MYQIKYIIVNDSAAKGSACESRHRFIPHIGHCAECFAVSGFKVQGSSERKALLNELCRLRHHWPEAPILGISEVDTSLSHVLVRVNSEMNGIRREMSELP